jgi:hypothetical protein
MPNHEPGDMYYHRAFHSAEKKSFEARFRIVISEDCMISSKKSAVSGSNIDGYVTIFSPKLIRVTT